MNYREDTKYYANVTINGYSPRADGETAARSEWVEIDPVLLAEKTYKERLALIAEYAENSKVHIRPATYGGRMRIWVKS